MEKPKTTEQFKNRERFGRNVEVKAIFMRHGPRAEMRDTTEKTLISEAGKKKIREIGKALETGRHGIKGYTSQVERAVETANLVLEEQEKNSAKVFKLRKKSELGLLPSSENFSRRFMEITNENLPWNFEELEEGEKQETFDKAEDKALDWWLKMRDRRPDEKTPSPQEVAADIAKLVNRYIRMADRLYSGSEIDLLNTSHKGTLEPFLKEVLIRKIQDEKGKEKIVRGFESIEEIGGGMRPAESWELDIKTDENGNKKVKLSLRGQEYDIDMERLKELVQLSKEQE